MLKMTLEKKKLKYMLKEMLKPYNWSYAQVI